MCLYKLNKFLANKTPREMKRYEFVFQDKDRIHHTSLLKKKKMKSLRNGTYFKSVCDFSKCRTYFEHIAAALFKFRPLMVLLVEDAVSKIYQACSGV